jgi:hypothetical protein
MMSFFSLASKEIQFATTAQKKNNHHIDVSAKGFSDEIIKVFLEIIMNQIY